MRFIGSKVNLLDNIKYVIDKHCEGSCSFCDIFSGTASVARYFKPYYEVYSNDLLYFSYCLQMATIEMPNQPDFKGLSQIGINNPLEYLNSLETEEMENLSVEKRFCQNNYSPNGGRMYFTDDNALRIDFARNIIEEWKDNLLISDLEYYYLIASIVEGVPFISNIAGTYGAFSKKWDSRASKKFQLINLPVINNERQNKSYNENGIDLLNHISGDILYIDPPYNERQYLPNYHVLETIARYDFPELRGITGQRPYFNEKSEFCSKRTVLDAFESIISNANFKHIILSYNTDGIMSIDDITAIMKTYGKPETLEINYIPYRRFKSHRMSDDKETLKELLVYIEKEI